jgi:hypothetical protein
MPGGGAFEPGAESSQQLLVHLAEKSEREMPGVPPRPAQLRPGRPQLCHRAVQFAGGDGRQRDRHE